MMKFQKQTSDFIKSEPMIKSSRLDTDSMLTSLLTWAGGESETKGKGAKKSWSNLMM